MASRTASKIDWLKERYQQGDKYLNTPYGSVFLNWLSALVAMEPKIDPLLPWLVREAKKGRIETDYDGRPLNVDRQELAHWADWYGSNSPTRRGTDIMQMTLPDMLDKIQDWDEELGAKMDEEQQMHGTVVHDFSDPENPEHPWNGWTVRRVDNAEQASREGDAMGHCVGGYGRDIESGNVGIFSLRDPRNQPHATVEIRPNQWEESNELPAQRDHPPLAIPDGGLVHQIQGKQNGEPDYHYKEMLRDWFGQVPGLGADVQKTTVPQPNDPDELNYWYMPEHDGGYDHYQLDPYQAEEYGLGEDGDDFEYEGPPDWHNIIDNYLHREYGGFGAQRKYPAYDSSHGDQIKEIAHDTGNEDKLNNAVADHQQQLAQEFYNNVYDPQQHSGTAPVQWNTWHKGQKMNALMGTTGFDQTSLPYEPDGTTPFGGIRQPVEVSPYQQKLFTEYNPLNGDYPTWQGTHARTADSRNTTFYHVAPASARESIQRQGLIGHLGTADVESPWADATWKHRMDQPHGNYLYQWPEQAMEYIHALKYKDPKRYPDPDEEDRIDWDHPCEHCNPGGTAETDEDWDRVSNCHYCQGAGYHEREEKPEWDIWKAHIDPDRQTIMTDPETALIHGELSQAEALHNFNQQYDWENQEYDGDRATMRWYTPHHIGPEQLEHYQSVKPSEMSQYMEEEPWSEDVSEKEVPYDMTQVPMTRYFGKTADYQGSTNWDTWHTKLLLDNDSDLYQMQERMAEEGWSPEKIRDWVVTHVIGPYNKEQIGHAQDWNEIPEEERVDHHYEDFKNKHGDKPGAMDLIHNLVGGPDVSDAEPTLMDPELVNWHEIHQNINGSRNEELERAHQERELAAQGINTWSSGHPEETQRLMDAWMKHHGINHPDEYKPYTPNSTMQVPLDALKREPSPGDYYLPEKMQQWQQQGYADQSIQDMGWQTLHDIWNGRANQWQRARMQAALYNAGYEPERVQHMTRQRWQWDPNTQQRINLDPPTPEPPADPSLDQPGDLTLPEGWTASRRPSTSRWRSSPPDDDASRASSDRPEADRARTRSGRRGTGGSPASLRSPGSLGPSFRLPWAGTLPELEKQDQDRTNDQSPQADVEKKEGSDHGREASGSIEPTGPRLLMQPGEHRTCEHCLAANRDAASSRCWSCGHRLLDPSPADPSPHMSASEPTGGPWSLYQPNPDGSVRSHMENPYERYSPNWSQWLNEREQHAWQQSPGTLNTTYKDQFEWVPSEYLRPMLEWDRNVHGDPSRVQRLHDSLKQEGFKEPVWLDFNPKTEMAHVSEGNHKLTAALQHGIPSVPVMVYRSGRERPEISLHHQYIGPERDHLGEPRPPQYMSPSEIGIPTTDPTPPWRVADDPTAQGQVPPPSASQAEPAADAPRSASTR